MTSPNNNNNNNNKEALAAKHYLDHISRLTVLHAKDLIAILSAQIESSKTILDIGCGPGTFALAYLDVYPKGIPGQTLILTDISPAMVQQAEEILKERVPFDFQTTLKFQVEDGLTLKCIPDNSIDVVVSVFGIFIIDDYKQTLSSIRRVLDLDNPQARLGTACWTTTEQQQSLQKEGFGDNFHQLLEESLQDMTSLKSEQPSWKRWIDPLQVQQMVVEDAGYDTAQFQSHRILHSAVYTTVNSLWNMLMTNPMSKLPEAPPETLKRLQNRLFQNLNRQDANDQRPVIVSTASNLYVARPLVRGETHA